MNLSIVPEREPEHRIRRRSPLELHVRDAFLHLHDLPYLRSHPLLTELPDLAGLSPAEGAQRLQGRLLAAIAALRPEGSAVTAQTERRHRLMHMRYVDAMPLEEVAAALGLGRSQYHREHTVALEAATTMFAPVALVPAAPAPQLVETAPEPPVEVLADAMTVQRTPFVGRGPELARLAGWYERAAAGQGGHCILISGQPGAGKTRLAQELGQYVRAHSGIFLDRQYERDGGLPYAIWAEFLRGGLRRFSANEQVELVGSLAAEVLWFCPELALLLEGSPSLPPMGPDDQRRRLFDACTDVLCRIAERAPLVLLLDDLQWSPQLDVFSHLARRLGNARLLLVSTARQDEMQERSDLTQLWRDLTRARVADTVQLPPLSAPECAEMAAHFLSPETTASLSTALYQRTGGNAFFLEEMLRSLTESGGAAEERALDATMLGLPDSVKALVTERVTRLGDRAHELLAQAAVLGQTFPLGLLAYMAQTDEDAVLTVVERALHVGLLDDASTVAEERYSFHEDQVQEVLYDGISAPRLRRLHLRAGEALEQLAGNAPEPYLEELARHFQRGGAAPKAAAYAYQAGLKADRVFSWNQAAELYRQALALWQSLGGHEAERAQVLETLAELSLKSFAHSLDTLEYAEEAIRLYEQLGMRAKIGRMHILVSRGYMSAHRQLQMDQRLAIRHLEQSITLLEETRPDDLELIVARGTLSFGYEAVLAFRDGVNLGRTSWDAGERGNNPLMMLMAGAGLGAGLVGSGRITEGFAVLDRSWEMARSARAVDLQDLICSQGVWLSPVLRDPANAFFWADRRSEFPTTFATFLLPTYLLGSHTLRGDLAAGYRVYRDLVEELRASGQPQFTRHPSSAGFLLRCLGLWDEARRVFDEGLAWADQSHFYLMAAGIRIRYAELLLDEGNVDAAHELLSWSRDRTHAGGCFLMEASALPFLALTAVRKGDLAAADGYLLDLAAILTSDEDWRGLAGMAAHATAVVRAAQDRWEDASAAVAEARAIYERYGLRTDSARLSWDWGLALSKRGSTSAEEGQRLLDRAQAEWRAMDAAAYAEAMQARRG
jgi:tetratricopeptide (TPR) repeat protein